MKLDHKSGNDFSNSYQPIMNKIANLFNVTLNYISSPKSQLWCIGVNSLNKIENVIKYFDYKDWCKAYYIILN
jgi:hypothetical protein